MNPSDPQSPPPDEPAVDFDAPTVRSPIGGAGLKAGRALLDRYRLEAPIGRGSMGVVWRAEDLVLRKPVALKFLPEIVARDADSMARMRAEANVLLGLSHDGIVRLHTLLVEDGLTFLVMEHLAGGSLSGAVPRARKAPAAGLSALDALWLLERLAQPIDYAHSKGVTHRDIKPGNVLLDRIVEGPLRESGAVVKLADFGIAFVANASLSQLSGYRPSGTLPFMAPEVLRGKRPQPAADIYSLAATLYAVVTGEPPFFHGDISWQVIHEAPEPPNSGDAHLDAALLAGLDKDPLKRPGSAKELLALARGEGASVAPTAVEGAAVPKASSPKRRGIVVASGVALALAVAAAARLLTGEAPPENDSRLTSNGVRAATPAEKGGAGAAPNSPLSDERQVDPELAHSAKQPESATESPSDVGSPRAEDVAQQPRVPKEHTSVAQPSGGESTLQSALDLNASSLEQPVDADPLTSKTVGAPVTPSGTARLEFDNFLAPDGRLHCAEPTVRLTGRLVGARASTLRVTAEGKPRSDYPIEDDGRFAIHVFAGDAGQRELHFAVEGIEFEQRLTLVRDLAPPTLEVLRPRAAHAELGVHTNRTFVDVELDLQDDVGIRQALAGDQRLVRSPDGRWRATELPLPDEGAHAIELIVEDFAGRRTSQSLTVVRDSIQPAAPKLSLRPVRPLVRGLRSELSLHFDEPLDFVESDGVRAPLDADRRIARIAVTPEGPSDIWKAELRAADLAGNTLSTPIELKVVDLTPRHPEGTVGVGDEIGVEGWLRRVRHERTGLEFLLVEPPADTAAGPYYLAEHPVTVAQWRQYLGQRRSSHPAAKLEGGYTVRCADTGESGASIRLDAPVYSRVASFDRPVRCGQAPASDDHPATQISGQEAAEFCAHYGLRLPTWDEWRVAYNSAGVPPQARNLRDASLLAAAGLPREGVDDGHAFAAPVRALATSGSGFYGLHGNVREWCATPFEGPKEQRCAAKCVFKQDGRLLTVAGASWWTEASEVAAGAGAAPSFGLEPAHRDAWTGFRPALDAATSARR